MTRQAAKTAVKFLLANGFEPFQGDAHAFLIWVYKHPDIPIDMRLDAARSAIPYEKPRLSIANITLRRPHEMTDEELAAAILEANEQAGVVGGIRGNTPGGTSATKH